MGTHRAAQVARTVLLAMALLATAACGGDAADDAASERASSAAASTISAESEAADDADAAPGNEAADEAGSDQDAATDSYPVTVEHARGSTTFEARPERIVTLNVQWTDAVVAMGVEPAAYVLSESTGETAVYPWQEGQLGDATEITTAGVVPLEQIAALEPDLILVTFLAAEDGDFELLEAIAPTIGFLGDLQVDPWQEQVELLGQILGEPERAAEVIAEVEGRVAEVAAELPGLEGATYTLANYVPGDGIYVIADPDDGSSRLFYGLGMEIDPEIVALDESAVGRVTISFEEIQLLDADMVGVLLNGTDPESIVGYSDLGAVQNETIINFELADVVGLNTPTPLSVPYLVDLMQPTLETVAGA